MTSRVCQILIAGAGTAAWWNAGDEAILSSMLRELRAQFPGVRIGVISANPKEALYP
jgi:polysaccharide pyruvyl transferase WcaK-like protein